MSGGNIKTKDEDLKIFYAQVGCSRCRSADTRSDEKIDCLHPRGYRSSMGSLHCANQRIPTPEKTEAW